MKKTKLKKYNLESFVIDFAMFSACVVVIVGPFDKVPECIAEFFESPNYVAHKAAAVTFIKERKPPVMWFERPPRTSREIATVAHESLHAVAHLMRHVDVLFSEDSEEVFCYAVEHCVTAILNAFLPKK